jgi:hypothetical protein
MPDGSRPSDRQMQLETEHLRLSELLNRLQEAIGELERAPFLNADAATRLDKYRQNFTRRQFERRQLELAIHELHGDIDIDDRVPTLYDEMLKRLREDETRTT